MKNILPSRKLYNFLEGEKSIKLSPKAIFSISLEEETKISTLCEASLNRPVRIKALNAEPSVCQRLREMGFCEFAEIRKVSHGSALICHVCGVKVALSRYLAKNIVVETIVSSTGSSAIAGASIRD